MGIDDQIMKTIIEAHGVSNSAAADYESQYSGPEIWWSLPLMRTFLWISVLTLGIGLGARLFNLIVLAGAWSASPPGSLALLPYSSRFPVNPGGFFRGVGTADTGWRSRSAYQRMERPVQVSGLVVVTSDNVCQSLGPYHHHVLADEP